MHKRRDEMEVIPEFSKLFIDPDTISSQGLSDKVKQIIMEY